MTLAFGFISLMGCSDDDDNPPATPDTSAPVISNISHDDNDTVTGSRAIAFTADVTDDIGATVTITHNGNPVTVTPGGNTYSASITLEDRTNNTIIVSASDADNTTTETITLNYPFLAFTNGQAASVVIGQENFESFDPQQGTSTTNADTLFGPQGLLIVDNSLYIADSFSNRIVGFNTIPTTNDANADFVIGQDSVLSDTGGLTNNMLTTPVSIVYENNHFFVLHGGSDKRVNHWPSLPVGNVASDLVIGQADFGAGSTVCENNLLSSATDIFVQGGKLLVADRSHHRVLIWNSVPASSGVAADLVLGQQELAPNCAPNDTDNNGTIDTPTASTLFFPESIWTDGTRLVVADKGNRRVLIWDSFPTTNFQAADRVLGQANFNASDNPSLASATNLRPQDITSNGNQLFVADTAFSRIMIWDEWPTENNQAADRVIGANDFLDDKTDLTNASKIESSDGMSLVVSGDKLLFSGGARNRVLIFQAP